MFHKVKKYVIGFFVLCGGILFAFLSGKSAGRKQEKLGGLDKKIKQIDKQINKTEKSQQNLRKNLNDSSFFIFFKKKTLKKIPIIRCFKKMF